MLIITNTMLAMHCPKCGKLEYYQLSMFSFSGGQSFQATCSCGTILVVINKHKNKFYRLQFNCIMCNQKHWMQVPATKMWSQQLMKFYCQQTGLELGCIGSGKEVRKTEFNEDYDLEQLIAEMQQDEYFNNSLIMQQAANYLDDLVAEDAVYCQCGSYAIDANIFPDRIELCCLDCDNINVIYVETEADLQSIRQSEQIKLQHTNR